MASTGPEDVPKTTAYFRPSGEGLRYLWQGQLATILASPTETAGLLEAAVFFGGPSASVPLHVHPRGHECLFVLDGTLDLTLGQSRHLMTRGGFASVPPGTVHGYHMREHFTRVLVWTVGGALTDSITRLGQRTQAATYNTASSNLAAPDPLADVSPIDDFSPVESAGASHAGVSASAPSADGSPYVLKGGSGEHLLAADQVFTFLACNRNTDGRFLVLSTLGPAGPKIPDHLHHRHTETFFCVDGRMTMWAGDREIRVLPGDFVHVPAGTVHAYRLDAPFTRFVGLLSPGVFEPFFRTLCDPSPDAIFPATPGPLRFDRVMATLSELDLTLVDGPR